MSVDRQELTELQARMHRQGVMVRYAINEQGYIDGACIIGAHGLKEQWRSPLSAAETMRTWLHERYMNRMHPERTRLGEQFSNERWRFS